MTEPEPTPEVEEESPPPGLVCFDCGEAVGPSGRFCQSCGLMQRAPRSLPKRATPVAAADPEQGPVCFACGAAVDEDSSGFCRSCGQVLHERALAVGQVASHSGGRQGRRPGHCHGCDAELPAGQMFCAVCGTASRLVRISPSELVAQDPGWYRVVKGLGLVYEGHVTLVVAAIAATAMLTVLGLFEVSWSQLNSVRAALLGAASLAAVVGMVMALVGKVIILSAPAESKVRLPTLVTLCIGAACTLLAMIVLIYMGSVGFDPARIPVFADRLSAGVVLLFFAQLVAFSTLLRQMAFSLQHYRIAQGSVGFIVFIGVGLAVVGLINMLFQSARPAAQTFATLLAIAFTLLVAFWYLNIVKRGRDLVRQRLP